MERADCEERLAPCQLQGCPPLAVILIMLMIMLLLMMMMIHYLFPLTHAHLPCPSKLITFETKKMQDDAFCAGGDVAAGPCFGYLWADAGGPLACDGLLSGVVTLHMIGFSSMSPVS